MTNTQYTWKTRENSVLLDVDKRKFKIHKRTRGKLRLFLGKFDRNGDFAITIPSITQTDPITSEKIRSIVKERVHDELQQQFVAQFSQ